MSLEVKIGINAGLYRSHQKKVDRGGFLFRKVEGRSGGEGESGSKSGHVVRQHVLKSLLEVFESAYFEYAGAEVYHEPPQESGTF